MKSRRPEKQSPETEKNEGATEESRETPAQVAARVRAYLKRKGYVGDDSTEDVREDRGR